MVGQPDPGCWALQPVGPGGVRRARVPLSTTSRELPTSSYNYPPWALVLPGLASFVPSAGGYAYLARLLNAAVPIALVAGVAASRCDGVARVLAASALLGLTPIAWFTFGFVSPSAVAIGGGLALWTGLLVDRSRLATWLTVAGWAAVLLPRRDGPVWATMIVLACCLLTATRPLAVLAHGSSRGRGGPSSRSRRCRSSRRSSTVTSTPTCCCRSRRWRSSSSSSWHGGTSARDRRQARRALDRVLAARRPRWSAIALVLGRARRRPRRDRSARRRQHR